MGIDVVELIGLCAAFASTVVLVPQIYKTWHDKSAKDISALMLANSFASSALWLIYGLLSHNRPITLCNVFTLTFSCVMVYLKWAYASKK